MKDSHPPEQIAQVLLIAFINSHFPELIRVAKFLRSTNQYSPTILYSSRDEYIRETFIDECAAADIPLITLGGQPITRPGGVSGDDAPTPRLGGVKHQLVTWLRTHPGLDKAYGRSITAITNLLSIWLLKGKISVIERLYRQLGVELIILTEENIFYETAAFVKTGHRLNVPSIIVPYTIANAVEAAEHAYDNRSLWVKGWWKTWMAKRYPDWVYRYRQQALLPISPWRILAQESLRLAPPDPWMFNSGFADVIAVESQHMMKYYVTNSLSSGRLKLIGSISDDILTATKNKAIQARQELYHQHGLAEDKPLLLCAFPPPWFPRPACDFPNYQRLTEFWMDALAKIDSYNVVINLHPRLSAKDFTRYCRPGRLVLTSQPVVELIPLCDLYVANVSATIRWAIACGKPVLNYDVYKYRFNDYDSAGGVVTIESKQDFLSYLRQLTTDQEFYRRQQTAQQSVSSYWGMLDGQSGRRLIGLIDQLVKRPESR